MKSRDNWIGNVLFVTCLISIGALGGAFFGFSRGRLLERKELTYLMEMPRGGMYIHKEMNTIFTKADEQALVWMKVPPPEQAQVMRDFMNPGLKQTSQTAPPPTTVPTTTTTIPIIKGDKK